MTRLSHTVSKGAGAGGFPPPLTGPTRRLPSSSAALLGVRSLSSGGSGDGSVGVWCRVVEFGGAGFGVKASLRLSGVGHT